MTTLATISHHLSTSHTPSWPPNPQTYLNFHLKKKPHSPLSMDPPTIQTPTDSSIVGRSIWACYNSGPSWAEFHTPFELGQAGSGWPRPQPGRTVQGTPGQVCQFCPSARWALVTPVPAVSPRMLSGALHDALLCTPLETKLTKSGTRWRDFMSVNGAKLCPWSMGLLTYGPVWARASNL